MKLVIGIYLLIVLVLVISHGHRSEFTHSKAPIQRINEALSKLITTEGCMLYFMGNFASSKNVSFYDHERDIGFRLWLFASQSDFCYHEEDFVLKIFFKNGEQIEWRSNDLHDPSEKWINWKASKKVYMQKPKVSGCDSYEDIVISVGNQILGAYVDDLVDSIYKVINDYKELQANKNKEFKEKYLEETQK